MSSLATAAPLDAATQIASELARRGLAAFRSRGGDDATADPLRYGFTVEGQRFAATATPIEPGFRLALAAELGIVPFTAEDPDIRARVLAIVAALEARDGGRLRVALGPGQRLLAAGEWQVDAVMTPSALIAEAALTVIPFRPYLRLFRGLVGPAPA
ncbi:MAG: hypothetical protein RID91_19990 [Azospirillaceae bacterium]